MILNIKHCRILLNFFLFVLLSLNSFGGSFNDSSNRSKKIAQGFNTTLNNTLSGKNLDEIDKIFQKQDLFQKNQSSEFTPEYFENFNKNSYAQISDYIDTARASMSELESTNNYVEFLTPSDLSKLPVGLKKKIGNTEVTIAVSNIIFTPKFAELTVFARIIIPQAPYKVYFGIKGLKLSHKGGIIGDAKLVLLGDLAIPINGRNSSLILKGGFDINTGQGVDKTYITIDCSGFKKLRIDADVEFPRSLLSPVDSSGNVILDLNTKVKGSFNTEVSNWNDILASFSLTPFQVKGLKDINFSVTTASFDFSDYRNSSDIIYPAGYQQKYLNSNTPEIWRGVYVKNLSVSLPRGFKDRTTSQRVTFGVNDMIIDNNGFTGLFYAENILPIAKGNAGGWKFSVDSIRIALEANNLLRASFGGKIGIPFSKDPTTSDTLNRKKYLSYNASISYNGDYLLNVRTLDSLSFDIWKANVLLTPNSYVQLKYENNELKPEAMLNGSMSINVFGTTAANEEANPNRASIAVFKGVTFRGLNIKSVAPYVTAEFFGVDGDLKIGQFPLSINSIALQTISPSEIGISFNVRVTLQDGDFAGSTGVTIIGNMNETQGIKSWKYDRLRIDSVSIHANINDAFELDGYVNFMDNDPIYGDGWRGGIAATFKKGLEIGVTVNAVFGKTTFRYWYIDGKVSFPGTGIPSPPPVYVYGFGGGAYYRMSKIGFGTPSPFGTSINYRPDSTAGLGVKAAVLFSVIKKKLVNGEASFEIAFNRGGGLKFIGLYGYAKVMAEIEGVTNAGDFVSNNFKNSEIKSDGSGYTKDQLDQQKMFQSTLAAQRTYASSSTPGQSGLEAYLGIQYDFNANTLHATFDIYANAANGLIQGIGTNNRAGWAVLHVSPSIWYLHAGTPSDKLGVSIGVGSARVRTGAYFMLGQNMPAFPPPPPIVVSILNQAGLNYTSPSMTGVSSGNGVAFGASLDVTTGDVRFLMLYARFSAGLGFDLMLTKWAEGTVCEGTNNEIGLKGWWAQGQAYAYLQGELGIRIKIGVFKKNVTLIRGSAAALVEAKLPNPTWFRATVGVNVRILGVINVNVGFKFTVGSLCNFVNNGAPGNDENPYDKEIKSIRTITPENNSTNKSVLIRPQVQFDIKPEQIITVDNVDGGPPDLYKPTLDYCKIVTSTGVEIPTDKVFNTDGDVLTLKLKESLNGSTNYKVMTKVSFQVKRGNSSSWVPLMNDGVKIEEANEVSFVTGLGVDSIPIDNCIKMYPFPEQKFLYAGESTGGAVVLNVGVSSIFSQSTGWKARFINIQTGVEAGFTTVSYDAGLKKISFAIPNNLPVSKNYRLEITKASVVAGGQDSSKPILTYKFKTSAYSTLAQKVQALQTVQGIVGRVSSEIINLQSKVAEYEGFETAELVGNNYTNYQPLISTTAILSDSFYLNKIQPLIYRSVPLSDSAGTMSFSILNRNTSIMGIPPIKAINVSSYYLNSINGYYGNYSKIRLPFIYDLPYYYSRDFQDLRTQVVNHYLQGTGANTTGSWVCYWTGTGDGDPYNNGNGQPPVSTIDNYQICEYIVNGVPTNLATVPNIFQSLVTYPFPFMNSGNYKIKIQYIGVDNVPGTFAEYNFINPIE